MQCTECGSPSIATHPVTLTPKEGGVGSTPLLSSLRGDRLNQAKAGNRTLIWCFVDQRGYADSASTWLDLRVSGPVSFRTKDQVVFGGGMVVVG